jgi:hypothetical protein
MLRKGEVTLMWVDDPSSARFQSCFKLSGSSASPVLRLTVLLSTHQWDDFGRLVGEAMRQLLVKGD